MSVPLEPKPRAEVEGDTGIPMAGLGLKALAFFPQHGEAADFEERKNGFMADLQAFVTRVEEAYGARFIRADTLFEPNYYGAKCLGCEATEFPQAFREPGPRALWAAEHKAETGHAVFQFFRDGAKPEVVEVND